MCVGLCLILFGVYLLHILYSFFLFEEGIAGTNIRLLFCIISGPILCFGFYNVTKWLWILKEKGFE